MSEIICCDAIDWLKTYQKKESTSFVASMPDISEFNLSLTDWKKWFTETALLILQASSDDGVTIFYQTDIKYEGEWVDKAFLCQRAAEELGHKLLWHKIICRAPAGVITMGRPSYSHILCFSKNLKLDLGRSTADVLPEMGEKSWERGIGAKAAQMIAKFIGTNTKSHTVINPFCGEGLLLSYLAAEKLNIIGIERSPKRAEKAKAMIQADL